MTPIGEARPSPPDTLTPDQAAEWRAVVNRLPQAWFPRETWGVLEAYCRHAVTHRFLSVEVDRFTHDWLREDGGVEHLGKLTAMRDRETKAMIAAARSLRITKSSQMRSEAAGRAMANIPEGPRPWDPLWHGGRS